jgi:hypothetical protein
MVAAHIYEDHRKIQDIFRLIGHDLHKVQRSLCRRRQTNPLVAYKM